jgi:succinate dehydrogenase/fumarate reductase flavoprotein subunit
MPISPHKRDTHRFDLREVHDRAADILIISKNRKADPHTVPGSGAINASLDTKDPEFNRIIHASDTTF